MTTNLTGIIENGRLTDQARIDLTKAFEDEALILRSQGNVTLAKQSEAIAARLTKRVISVDELARQINSHNILRCKAHEKYLADCARSVSNMETDPKYISPVVAFSRGNDNSKTHIAKPSLRNGKVVAQCGLREKIQAGAYTFAPPSWNAMLRDEPMCLKCIAEQVRMCGLDSIKAYYAPKNPRVEVDAHTPIVKDDKIVLEAFNGCPAIVAHRISNLPA